MARGHPEIEKLHRAGKAPAGAKVLGPHAIRYPPKDKPSPARNLPREEPEDELSTYKDYTVKYRRTLGSMHSGNPCPGMHYDIGHKMALGARRSNPIGKQHKFPRKKI